MSASVSTPQGDDPRDPCFEDALTLDQIIAQLEALRQRYGGGTQVYMCDEEPIVWVGYCPHGRCVVISDRYQTNKVS
jgi:hypothetical protein